MTYITCKRCGKVFEITDASSLPEPGRKSLWCPECRYKYRIEAQAPRS